MDYIPRDLEPLVASVSDDYSCVLVIGPRQVGKTTMLQHLDASRRLVTLDDLELRSLARRDPEYFLQVHPAPVLIDEVQYAPELFPYLKMAADAGAEPGSYWLTGSQAFRMMELAQESLAGRVAVLHMPALSQHEIFGKAMWSTRCARGLRTQAWSRSCGTTATWTPARLTSCLRRTGSYTPSR